jgi:hypothetical protein
VLAALLVEDLILFTFPKAKVKQIRTNDEYTVAREINRFGEAVEKNTYLINVIINERKVEISCIYRQTR